MLLPALTGFPWSPRATKLGPERVTITLVGKGRGQLMGVCTVTPGTLTLSRQALSNACRYMWFGAEGKKGRQQGKGEN